MDIKTKHRVIGIIVIIALAVILVPLFFTRSAHDKTPSLSADMPTAPNKSGETPLAIQPQSSNDAMNNAALTPPTPDNSAATNPADADNSAANDENQNTAMNDTAASTTATPSAAAAASAPTATAASDEAGTASSGATKPTAPVAEHEKVQRNKTGEVKTRLVERHHEQRHHQATHLAKPATAAEAWTIQLASFSEKSHAEKLVKKLRQKGFPAYVHEAHAEHNSIARVYVGPELNKEKADKLMRKLHEEFRLQGEVIKYKA